MYFNALYWKNLYCAIMFGFRRSGHIYSAEKYFFLIAQIPQKKMGKYIVIKISMLQQGLRNTNNKQNQVQIWWASNGSYTVYFILSS